MHRKKANSQGMRLRHNFIHSTSVRTTNNSLYGAAHDFFLKYPHRLLKSLSLADSCNWCSLSHFFLIVGVWAEETRQKAFLTFYMLTHFFASLGAVFIWASATNFKFLRKNVYVTSAYWTPVVCRVVFRCLKETPFCLSGRGNYWNSGKT